MMEDIRKYVLSVIISALFCGILPGLLQNGALKDLTKAVCGLILTLSVVSPFRDFSLSLPEGAFFPGEESASGAVSEGEALAQEAAAQIIKAETEAYILDKAAELNAQLQVDVCVSRDNPPVPVSAVISGKVSNQTRSTLQEILSVQLNIPKEDQTWIE